MSKHLCKLSYCSSKCALPTVREIYYPKTVSPDSQNSKNIRDNIFVTRAIPPDSNIQCHTNSAARALHATHKMMKLLKRLESTMEQRNCLHLTTYDTGMSQNMSQGSGTSSGELFKMFSKPTSGDKTGMITGNNSGEGSTGTNPGCKHTADNDTGGNNTSKGTAGDVSQSTAKVDEIQRFDRQAEEWWDVTHGKFIGLHHYVPLRLAFIIRSCTLAKKQEVSSWGNKVVQSFKGKGAVSRWLIDRKINQWTGMRDIPEVWKQQVPPSVDRQRLKDVSIIDVGCGGGILAEALAVEGADVIAVDASKESVAVAKIHSEKLMDTAPLSMLKYYDCELSDLVLQKEVKRKQFDVVVASEVIEHVSDPPAFLQQLSDATKPGGVIVITTIAQNPIAWTAAILIAENVLNLAEKGTHHYKMLVSPSHLVRMATKIGLCPLAAQGTFYIPGPGIWLPIPLPTVTYMMSFRKPKETE